jgi:hypothetical protein
MRTLTKALLAAAAFGALAGASAHAQVVDTLTVNGGWNVFYFLAPASSGDDPSFQDINGEDITYDFTLNYTDKLYVTDGYWDGDQFDVTINGVDQGPTSTPVTDGTYVGDDWWAAVGNPEFSSAVYTLGPGSYSVTGVVIQSPYGSGAGAINLTGAVPEPSTWATMLLGIGALGLFARRRRTAPA